MTQEPKTLDERFGTLESAIDALSNYSRELLASAQAGSDRRVEILLLLEQVERQRDEAQRERDQMHDLIGLDTALVRRLTAERDEARARVAAVEREKAEAGRSIIGTAAMLTSQMRGAERERDEARKNLRDVQDAIAHYAACSLAFYERGSQVPK